MAKYKAIPFMDSPVYSTDLYNEDEYLQNLYIVVNNVGSYFEIKPRGNESYISENYPEIKQWGYSPYLDFPSFPVLGSKDEIEYAADMLNKYGGLDVEFERYLLGFTEKYLNFTRNKLDIEDIKDMFVILEDDNLANINTILYTRAKNEDSSIRDAIRIDLLTEKRDPMSHINIYTHIHSLFEKLKFDGMIGTVLAESNFNGFTSKRAELRIENESLIRICLLLINA